MIESGDCLIILDGLDEVTDPSLRIQVTDRTFSRWSLDSVRIAFWSQAALLAMTGRH